MYWDCPLLKNPGCDCGSSDPIAGSTWQSHKRLLREHTEAPFGWLNAPLLPCERAGLVLPQPNAAFEEATARSPRGCGRKVLSEGKQNGDSRIVGSRTTCVLQASRLPSQDGFLWAWRPCEGPEPPSTAPRRARCLCHTSSQEPPQHTLTTRSTPLPHLRSKNPCN